MKNGRTHFNLSNTRVVGPRLMLSLIFMSTQTKAIDTSDLASAFDIGTATCYGTLKSGVRKGLVREVTKHERRCIDGGRIGTRYRLTPAGRKLVKRAKQVEGLGRQFGLVRGAIR